MAGLVLFCSFSQVVGSRQLVSFSCATMIQSQGEVLLDGVNIKTLNPSWLRQQASAIFFFFSVFAYFAVSFAFVSLTEHFVLLVLFSSSSLAFSFIVSLFFFSFLICHCFSFLPDRLSLSRSPSIQRNYFRKH